MSIQTLLEICGFVVTIGGILYGLAYQKGKSEQIESNLNLKIDQHIGDDMKLFDGLRSQLQKMWDWKDQHERDAANMRLELQKQIGKVEAGLSIHDGHYSEIVRLIASMERSVGDKIDKLEKSIENIRRN